MGVYIKGMEKPYTCYDCDFTDNNDDCFFGLGYALENRDCVYENCPLIEVTEPHGRLVDESKIHTGIRMEKNTEHRYFIDKVNAPTVIEAEVK